MDSFDTFLYQLNVTRRCNLRCSHCYISSDKKDISPDWSESDFLHVIGSIKEYMISDYAKSRGHKKAEIHVIGGEPTELGIEFFENVLPAAHALLDQAGFPYKLSLVTNLLTPQSLAVAKLFRSVSTSFEPETRFTKPKHHQMWLSNIQEYQCFTRERGIPGIGITSAITKKVIAIGAKDYLESLVALGFRNIHLGFFIPSGDGDTNRDELQPEHSDTSDFLIDAFDWYVANKGKYSELYVNPCQSWIQSMTENKPFDDIVCPILSGALDVDGDGETISCIERGGVIDYPSNGNLLETVQVIDISEGSSVPKYVNSISKILTGPSYLKEVASARLLPNVCLRCEHRKLCLGNCSVLHGQWDQSGDCPGFKRFLDHVSCYVRDSQSKYSDHMKVLQS
tara:strand:+ start:7313 stop:8500 length:1188 start_codon:yes stop_codon:yes gene_type:complete